MNFGRERLCLDAHCDLAGYPDVLYLVESNFEYRLYDKGGYLRVPYDGASAFCASLDPGWALVPYTDHVGFDAVRQLCADNFFTCWLNGDFDDEEQLCPLMASDGTLQMQDCHQDVRFVCRNRIA